MGAISTHQGRHQIALAVGPSGLFTCCALVTDGDTNDVRIAQKLDFAPGTIVAMDRGYLDYALYERGANPVFTLSLAPAQTCSMM